MSSYNDRSERNNRVTLAWIILGLQILGLILLLLFGRDRLQALVGDQQEAAPTAQPTSAPEPTAVAEEPAEAVDTAATADAEAAAATAAAQAAEPTAEEPPPDESAAVPGSVSDAVGRTWFWTGSADAEGNETAVDNPQNYVLVFWPDGSYNIKADCNVGSGRHSSDDEGGIELSGGPMTLAACPAGSRDGEFLETLSSARSIAFNESGDMVLGLEDGSTAIFANAGEAEVDEVAEAGDQPGAADAGLTGRIFQWPGFTDASGAEVTVDNPENYTITLLPDGTFTVVADCNLGGGSYVYGDDGSLQLGPIRTTRAQCPEGSQSDTFLAFLEGASSAAVAADGTVTVTTADGSSATFIGGGPVAESDLETVAAEDDNLVGTVWQWTAFSEPGGAGDLTVEDPAAYTLLFLPGTAYTINADCNIGRGSYTRDGDSLTLDPAALTRVLCPPESLGDQFVLNLERVASYTITDDGNLELSLADDGGVMTFAPAAATEVASEPTEPQEQPAAVAAGLTGFGFQWPGFTDASGNTVEVENPEDYVVVLFPDGTYSVRADCNVGSGTFTYDETGAVTLLPGILTRAQCPENSQSDVFLGFLSSADTATVEDDGSVTVTTSEGGSATFINLGEVEATGVEDAEESAQPLPTGNVLNTVWQWAGFTAPDADPVAVEDPEIYYLVLIDDGTYAFRADCKNGASGYTLDETTLTLEPVAVTQQICSEDSLSDVFINYLSQPSAYSFTETGDLVLTLTDGTILNFANGGPFEGLDTGSVEVVEAADPLAGTGWLFAHFRDAKQDFDVAGEATITFGPDGTLGVVSECINGEGTYRVDGQTLNISVPADVFGTCPAESHSNSLAGMLNQPVTFAIDGAVLTVELPVAGGTLTFSELP